MPDPGREIHLLLRDASGARVLVAGSSLPTLTVALAPGQTTVAGAIPALRAEWDVHGPLLEIHFDYAHDDASGPVPVLTTMEPSDGFEPPDGFAWHDLAGPDPQTAAGLRPRLAELLAEWRAGVEPPPLRPRWARPGWHARAAGWLTDRLTELGRPPTGPIDQVRHWGISAVLRVPTESGSVWMKAVFPPFHHEPAVTRVLADAFPALVPSVVATEDGEGWLALEDLGSAVVRNEDEGPGRVEAPRALVAIQRAMAGRTAELEALGAPRRPLRALPDELRALLDEEPRLTGVAVDGATGDRAVERVQSAVDSLVALALPETLVHGDFHAGNVALVAGRPVTFDWSDAAIGNPLMDVITWVDEDDPARREGQWAAFVDAWSDVVPPARLRAGLPDVLAAGAAYQVMSYAGIVRNLEPLRRPENADGLEDFLGRILGPGT